MDYNTHLHRCILHAKERFKDFKAELTQLEGISILNWKNKNGDGEYFVRFIFDEEQERMFVSGDLGHAVFHFTEKATLFSISKYSSLSYFMEKMVCSTNKWEYDRTSAMEELRKICKKENEDYDDGDIDVDELIDDIMHEYDQYGDGMFRPSDSVTDRISQIDPDYWEWLYDIGAFPHTRIILWWQSLKMAAKQIERMAENG